MANQLETDDKELFEAYKTIIDKVNVDHGAFTYVIDDCLITGDVVKNLKELGAIYSPTGNLMGDPRFIAHVMEGLANSYLATAQQILGLNTRDYLLQYCDSVIKTRAYEVPPRMNFRIQSIHKAAKG